MKKAFAFFLTVLLVPFLVALANERPETKLNANKNLVSSAGLKVGDTIRPVIGKHSALTILEGLSENRRRCLISMGTTYGRRQEVKVTELRGNVAYLKALGQPNQQGDCYPSELLASNVSDLAQWENISVTRRLEEELKRQQEKSVATRAAEARGKKRERIERELASQDDAVDASSGSAE